MKKIIKDNCPLFVFGLGITAFMLIFARFFMKMDDGNFLGIANAPDFSYEEFLTYRYNNISGRTINEFLVMFFCRHNIILWKLFVSALLIFVVCFFNRLSSCFSGEFSKSQREIFCALGIFMMMVSCLNPSVFWFAGSFTYILPFAGLCAVSLPFLKYIYENRFSLPLSLFGISGCVAACSQEQGAVCCTALVIVLFIAIKIKKLTFKPIFLLNLIFSVGLTVYLFTSPGMSKRIEAEASGFERFNGMNAVEKIFCGISTFFANSFYLSFVLIFVLVAFLSVAVYSVLSNKPLAKKILTAINCFCIFVCVGVNIFCCVSGKGLSHMLVRSAFIKGYFSPQFICLAAFGFGLLVAIICLCFFVAVKKPSVGVPVFICLSAGFGCGMMMGFSSSIFASGQRAFFLTNMFIVTACVILVSSIQKTKFSQKIYSLAVFYAVATAVADVFAFAFIEHPLMG